MRIRKRQVPLPLSSLSPVPLSDLRLDPPVQLRHSAPLPPPLRRAADFDLELDLEKEEEDEKGSRMEEEGKEKSNDSSIIFAPPTTTSSMINPSHSISSSSSQVERWCDGDKAFPLKKRRGSFERGDVAAVKMKTKMNNKCDLDHHHRDHGEDDHGDDAKKEERELVLDSGAGGSTGKKKRGGRGGAVLMEGSRCSRVNGRGWRCCQQTLVGYSLCEHHLGKGRLRSMASVRSRSLAGNGNNVPKKKNKKSTTSTVELMLPSSDDHKIVLLENRPKQDLSSEPVSSCFLLSDEDEDEEVKGEPLMVTNKKRMRLGMVKARSMSSLLGQPQPIINNNITYADHRDRDHDHNHNHMQI